MVLSQLGRLRLEHWDSGAVEASETSTVCVVTRQMPFEIPARADTCPVSAADICPVSTADICPVSEEDIWPVWGHLGGYENDFDPFLHQTCAKWNKPAQEHEAPEMQPHAAARGQVLHAPGARIT